MQQPPDSDLIILLNEPLVRADFSRLSVGDMVRLGANPNHHFALLAKCAVDDLDNVSIDHAIAIVQKFNQELGRIVNDLLAAREILA